MTQDQAQSREVGVDRLLTFSDGVFAIAVTLLVLDLREPTVSHGVLHALLKQWPSYASYVLSFLIVGIIWAQHHLMFRFIRRTDHLFLLINVVFLMWVAFIPFPTALLARYLENPGERQAATAIYAGVFLLGSVLVNLRWKYATHHRRLLDDGIDPRTVRTLTWNYAIAPVLYLLVFAVSFVNSPASISLLVLIGLYYALSPLLGQARSKS